jgi:hypothetical protein
LQRVGQGAGSHVVLSAKDAQDQVEGEQQAAQQLVGGTGIQAASASTQDGIQGCAGQQSTAVAAKSQQASANGQVLAPFLGQLTQQGDFVHPHTVMLLTQPATKYMLDPAAQRIAGDADIAEEEGAMGSAGGAAGAGALPAKTPGTAGAKTKSKGGRPPKHGGAAAAATPAPLGLGEGGSIPSTPAPPDAQPAGHHIKAEGAQAGVGDAGPGVLEGGSTASAPPTTSGRGGRHRASVNYSLLAGGGERGDEGGDQPAELVEPVKPRGRGGKLRSSGNSAANTPATVGASASGATAGPLMSAQPLLGPPRQPALGGSRSRTHLGDLVDHPVYQAVAGGVA